jgi:hypothetical protein
MQRRWLGLGVVVTVLRSAGCAPALGAGEDCSRPQPVGVSRSTFPEIEDDPCKQSGHVCIYQQSGGEVCTAATACKADSDCPSNFACSALDLYDGTTYCATSCTTGSSCGDPACASGCVAGYGCAADGVACELYLGLSCYVTDTSGPGCGAGAACSAVTRVCTLTPQCNDDSECSGFACQNQACTLSCTQAVDSTDYIGCASGFVCNPQTFICSSTLGGPCDPASDDGTQCGLGDACSPASQTCVSATPCNTDAECSGYGCQNGYCLLACTKNILPCTIGKTCDLGAHTCS